MKTTAAAVLLLFFLFSTISCLLSVTNAEKEPVLDIDGDELRVGSPYYIVSSIRGGGGGGLDLGSSPKQICPKFVIQHSLDLFRGSPVVFYPTDENISVVNESMDVMIGFLPRIDAYCRSETTWKVDDYDPSTGNWWITTGSGGHPGPSSLMSWFKIEKFAPGFTRSYRITFCPSVCDSCITLCNAIDKYASDDQGPRRLHLSKGSGWSFDFVKASIEQVAGKEMH